MRVMICATQARAADAPDVENWMKAAQRWQAELVVLPAYLAATADPLVVRRLSARYPAVAIVSGAHEVDEDGALYEQSSLMLGGDAVLVQRAAYLSKAQRARGLVRAQDASVYAGLRLPVGIALPTDAWYPQVWRALALKGAKLVACPWTVPVRARVDTESAFLASCWQNAHQNGVFAALSGYTGEHHGEAYRGFGAVVAPLTRGGPLDGVHVRVEQGCEVVDLEERMLERARARFDPMRHLNARWSSEQPPFALRSKGGGAV